ncbi:methylated-DNA--[protein]-cysteine S-methyltransferase [Aquicella lusitana]|uniref:methylated-DNA--[protein]-cysteine S-methyltransferase n=1 Tax=Aquicella lusitana TaxID=254246 RepID=A0A370GM62_9COXI|nr:methylated-DNA--[protein]-cysteine S-methyltransferase [Aquicella lusitana]RDI44828.1 methylated-DNA-[protein]-cysteine S-methyltransferase [Aquicella lusitana]VVC73025.1 Methylated-DNA--protein-cysteine methyltransferase [Aquicella lusitana]
MTEYTSILSSPLGHVGIQVQAGTLINLSFLPDTVSEKYPQDAFGQKIADELSTYFDNPQHQFTVSVHCKGTPFQQKVWNALQGIPSGNTLTYGALAKQLGSSARAVGQACRTNPIPLIVPCHRIVAANHLGGYAGATEGTLLRIKRWLLQHEGVSLA